MPNFVNLTRFRPLTGIVIFNFTNFLSIVMTTFHSFRPLTGIMLLNVF